MLTATNMLSVPEVACYQSTSPMEGATKVVYAIRKPGEALWAAFALFRTENYLLRTVDIPATYRNPHDAVLEARFQLQHVSKRESQPRLSLTLLKGGKV